MLNLKRAFIYAALLCAFLYGVAPVSAQQQSQTVDEGIYIGEVTYYLVPLPCDLPTLSVWIANGNEAVDQTKINLPQFVCDVFPRMLPLVKKQWQTQLFYSYNSEYGVGSGRQLVNNVPTGITNIGSYPANITNKSDSTYIDLTHEMRLAIFLPITPTARPGGIDEGLATATSNILLQNWAAEDPSIQSATSSYMCGPLMYQTFNAAGGAGEFYANPGVDSFAAIGGCFERLVMLTPDHTFAAIDAAIGLDTDQNQIFADVAKAVPVFNGLPTDQFLRKIPAFFFNGIDGSFLGAVAIGGLDQLPYVNWGGDHSISPVNTESISFDVLTRTNGVASFPTKQVHYGVWNWQKQLVHSNTITISGGGAGEDSVDTGPDPDGAYMVKAYVLLADGVTPDPSFNTAVYYYMVSHANHFGDWEFNHFLIAANPTNPNDWGTTVLTGTPDAVSSTNGMYDFGTTQHFTVTDGTNTRTFDAYLNQGISTVEFFNGLDNPNLYVGGAVNAASFAAGVPLAQGSLFSVFGYGLCQNVYAGGVFNSDGTLSFNGCPGTSANNQGASQMYFIGNDGSQYNVPILYGGFSQFNGQVPWNLPVGQATLYVSINGNASNGIAVTIGPSSPGIFITVPADPNAPASSASGAVLHLNGTAVTTANPAKPGEAISVYATGFGITSPEQQTGVPASATTLAFSSLKVMAEINSDAQPSLFAGLAPGFVGLNQLNITVPMNVSGSVILAVSIQNDDGTASQSNSVTVPVE